MTTRVIVPILASLCLAASGLLLGSAQAQNNAGQSPEQFKPIGKVITAAGAVNIEHTATVLVQASAPSGGRAKAGDLVYQGDVVETGVDGTAGIVFTDGTTFNISSNARMELNELVYDPKGSSNSTLFNLKKGTFTFLAGAVAKTGNMKVETPVGTMGIRGTAPRVEIADDGTVKFSTLIEEDKKAQKTAVPGQRRAASSTGQSQNATLAELQSCNGTDRASADSRIRACTALAELRVDNPQALAMVYNNRGLAWSSKGDHEAAIRDFDQSIKFDPAYAKAYNNRGISYQKRGDYDSAIKDFDTALIISPDYANALANRAQVHEKKRDYDRALVDFDEAIRLQPTLASLWNDRCWIRAIVGSLQEALADCNEAIRLGPPAAAKFDSRGFTYLKSGQWASAIADYDSALRLNPTLASSLYGRGKARLKTGNLAGGNADLAAATRVKKTVAEEFARMGLQ